MRSVVSVVLGILLAMLIGFLLVFGALAPILSVVFGLDAVAPAGLLPYALLLFCVGFAFYFGGMAAAYQARRRRVLHGVLVAVVACIITPLANLVSGEGAFPAVDSTPLAVGIALAAVAAVGAAFVGGKRGAALYEFNSRHPVTKKRSRRRREPQNEEAEEQPDPE